MGVPDPKGVNRREVRYSSKLGRVVSSHSKSTAPRMYHSTASPHAPSRYTREACARTHTQPMHAKHHACLT